MEGGEGGKRTASTGSDGAPAKGLGGGTADKRGNEYEAWWTALRLLELVDAKVDRIRLEPPGDEGAGAELWVESKGVRCYDQVKDVPSRGSWTPTRVAKELMSKLEPHLRAGHRIRLVVSTPATRFTQVLDLARAEEQFETFERILPDEQAASFEAVRSGLGCDDVTAHRFLRQTEVTVWPRSALLDHVRLLARFAFRADPEEVLDQLIGYSADRLHQVISAPDVSDFLASRSIARNLLTGDPTLTESFRKAGRTFARSVSDSQQAEVLPRPELGELLRMLDDEHTPQIVLVDGGAGSGKSSLVAAALAELDSRAWATCGMRMDRVPPDTLTSAALADHLGLPASPGSIAAALSQSVRTIIAIDQLDAVCQFSGRMSQPFEAVTDVLDEMALGPQGKVVLVVRTIDLDNDTRLAALMRDEQRVARFTLGDFSDDQLKAGLELLGVGSSEVSADLMDLLRVPLHFAVFSRLSPSARTRQFASLPDLYRSYTSQVRNTLEARSAGFAWDDAIGRIVEHISQNETLAIPLLALAGAPPRSVELLASSGVLTIDGDFVGFFHETYFDYLFAVAFTDANRDLLEFVVESGQQLFRRTQVRQILVHVAGISPRKLAPQVRALLTDPRVRNHLKDTAVSVFALVGASPDNWTEIEDLVRADDWIGRRLRSSLISAKWFETIDSAGRWPGLLAQDFSWASEMLIDSAASNPLRAAELVGPYTGASAEWSAAIALLVERHFCIEMVPFALRLIEAGELDGASSRWRGGSGYWSLVEEISEQHPIEAAQIVGAYLQRGLVRADKDGAADPFQTGDLQDGSRGADTVLEDVATAAPAAVLDATIPFIAAVCERTAEADEDRLRRVPAWRFRSRGRQHTVAGSLLDGADRALQAVGESSPEQAAKVARTFGGSDIEVLRLLACRAFTSNINTADEALIWLAADDLNLSLGWTGARSAATRELIAFAAQWCSEKTLATLTDRLLDYWPSWEFGHEPGRRFVGVSQQALLSEIPTARRSATAARRLEEHERRFGPPEPIRIDDGIRSGWVGSPIPPAAAPHMSDGDWLRAMSKYGRGDAGRGRSPFTGGAAELAQLLEGRAKVEPQRFASLAMRFDSSTHLAYAEAVIRGASPKLSAAERGELMMHLADEFGSAIGRTICWSLDELAYDADRTAAALIDRFASDPEPVNEPSRDPERDRDSYDMESAGINSIRGAAARACASILFDSDAHLEDLRPIVDRMVEDPSVAVRTAASSAVLALSNHDRPAAQVLVETLLDHPDGSIYDSSMIQQLLTYAAMWDPGRTAGRVQAALTGPTRIADRAGSVWAVLLCRGQLPDSLPADVTELSAAARLGAADVLAGWVDGDPDSLCTLLGDPDPEVAAKAAGFTSSLDEAPPSVADSVLRRFASQPAFANHVEPTMYELTRLPGISTETVLALSDSAIAAAACDGVAAHDTRFVASTSILTVIVRTYRQGPDAVREQCLDIIDRLCELRVYGLDKALDHTRSE